MSSQASHNLRVGALIAIAVSLVIFGVFGTAKFVMGYYFGSPVILNENILTTTQSLPFFKAHVTGDAMLDSGSYEGLTISGADGPPTPKAYFGFLAVGDHFLMVRTKGMIQEDLTEYSGVLTSINDNKIALDVYNDYLQEFPELKGVVVPALLDTDYQVMGWFMGLSIEAGVLVTALVAFMLSYTKIGTTPTIPPPSAKPMILP